jgi:zeaxanthin glucosyltransferase
MKLGFISINVPGHLNPMTTLARHLQGRGHEVVFLYSSGAAGLPFVPSPEVDRVSSNILEVSTLQRDEVWEVSVSLVLAQTEIILKSLPRIAAENKIDALVLDAVQWYAELGAMKLGVPYVHVSNALYYDYSGHTPLAYYDWQHETTPEALARNRKAVQKFAEMLGRYNGGIKAYAKRAGLNVDWDDPGYTLSTLASITQTPRAFDFESSHWPPHFYHTGPFHDGKGREKLDFPWERLTSEPLIYASMGTLLNGRVDVFRTIVAAAAKQKDSQLVLSVGNLVNPEEIRPAPRNAIIVNQAPQLELLKRACVCITHAGLNTVLESLVQGVPQLAIPVAYDQPGVGARIARKRTGVVTALEKLTADHLAFHLNEVLTDNTYRQNARRLQKAIADADGLSVAADLIEEAFGVKERQRSS